MKYKTLVLPTRHRLDDVCSVACRKLIEQHCDPIWNELDRDLTAAELSDLIGDAEILLTSWGSPAITAEMLARAGRLRVVAHAAGSVKSLVPESIFDRDIAVFSAAPRIAWSVGEYCLMALLTMLNRLAEWDANVRESGWKSGDLRRRELTKKRVGIVSASSTARAFIRLLEPFNCEVLVYDPYLEAAQMARLGAQKATLEEVMQCEIISLHIPSIPETKHMIGAELLSLIPDGGILINSSRAAVVEEHELIAQLQSGRFLAAFDVFHAEPLRADHPFLSMDNVLLTPHIAGDTVEGHQALMYEVLSDVFAYLGGAQPKYAVDASKWAILA